MNEDEIKGTAKDAAGKIKDAVGGLAGDEELQAEGKADQIAGKAQKFYGAAKDSIGAAVDTARDALGHATAVDDMTGTAERVSEKFNEFVRAQPVLAMLGTAAAGYALALLIHGGSRRR
ncbi:CsbD family protein [Acidiphilium sp. AL]|uniref:CsbD family protein n=1 Tax=Acidiphilium sp. AL TaxID=2871704 RepID=UPI0021CB4728|nr:CsbD family protein [Acidiphilium sp. AL]